MTAAVALVGLTLAATGGLASRQLVHGQEERLLRRAGAEAGTLMSSVFLSADSSLRVLNGIDDAPTRAELSNFAMRPGPLGGPTLSASTISERPEGFVVAAHSGDTPADNSRVDAARSAIAVRALKTGLMVTGVLTEGGASRLVFGVAGPAPARWVTLQESAITPNVPFPQTPGSAFTDLRGALFASADARPESMILTTAKTMPLKGRVLRTLVPVGANTFVLLGQPRAPLVGRFATAFPWMLVFAGCVAALFAALTAWVLSRRRAYALAMVDERTAELGQSLAELTQTRSELQRMVTGGPTIVVKRELEPPRVTYVSPNMERILGHRVDTAMSAEFLRSIAHPDDLDDLEATIRSVASGSVSSGLVEVRELDGSGDYRWMSLQVWPDDVADGRVTTIVFYGVDVDDRHKAEEAQREAQRVAETANAAKSLFLSHVSHELRTPLNAILGFGQLLETEGLTLDQRESVEHILDGGRHLLTLVNEVLDVSSVESGHLRLVTDVVNPVTVIGECVDLLGPAAKSSGVTVSVHSEATADEPQFVYADALRVKQVVLNLLSNAIKYNQRGGVVSISTTRLNADRLRIAVSDDGRGIAANRLDQLFVPFERLGAEETDIDGVGLGLALARQLARAMDGEIEVQSTAGIGSTFTLELPAVPTPVEFPATGHEDLPPKPSLQVLHIDDDLVNLRLVERILAKDGRFTSLPAMSGSLGLELARQHHPALIVLDLHLPDMTGETVVAALRADPATADIPLVILSGDAVPNDRVASLVAAGVDAYLQKPIDVATLLELLERTLTPLVVH